MQVQENQTIGEVISRMMSEARRLGFAESYIWDIWIVKRYLEHFSKLGHSTLTEVTLNDVRDYIMECALAVKSSTLHDIFVYMRQFHVYLKKSGIEAPDAEGLFSDTIHREMPIQGYITDDEISKITQNYEVVSFTASSMITRKMLPDSCGKFNDRSCGKCDECSFLRTVQKRFRQMLKKSKKVEKQSFFNRRALSPTL